MIENGINEFMLNNRINKFILNNGIKEIIGRCEYYNLECEDDYFYLIDSGIALLKQQTITGKEIILKIMKAGNIYICNKSINDQMSLYFKENGSVIRVSRKKLLMQKENSELVKEINEYLLNESMKKDMMLRDLLVCNKTGNFISMIIRLSNSFGKAKNDEIIIDIKLTHDELSQCCGTTRENISRTMKDLIEKETIEYRNSRIIIKNINQLKDLMNCEDCPIHVCNTF
ncbi:Crp/Fnr family transcriptional regulator [Lysinibacillus sp. NPDC056959]|uniref:Crp/Fnr family transcriptional regulator n=1 Tax=Lysinibacillus sp. NPDC056959 TaxID=3345981 RepID=UPI00363CF221